MKNCLEKKLTLSGGVQTFPCQLVRLDEGFGVLRHVLDREFFVGNMKLLPGDVTCALYWEDRPYTLYTWRLTRSGRTLYYFNIADQVFLQSDEFLWRDLIVDIFIDLRGRVHVLDEDDLPAGLDSGLTRFIESAKAHILDHYPDVIREVSDVLAACAVLR